MKITVERYREIFNQTVKECQDLGIRKGGEYTGQEGAINVHANFDRLATKLMVDSTVILMVYLTKHLDSIDNYVKNKQGKVESVYEPSEPMSGRINDAINYLILLKAMLIRDSTSNQAGDDKFDDIDWADRQRRIDRVNSAAPGWANLDEYKNLQQQRMNSVVGGAPAADSYLGSVKAMKEQEEKRQAHGRRHSDAENTLRFSNGEYAEGCLPVSGRDNREIG